MRSSNDPDRPTYVSKTTVAMVSLRMPLGLKEQIQNDIDTKGDVKNLTEWITIAIRKYLEERTGGGGLNKVKKSFRQRSFIPLPHSLEDGPYGPLKGFLFLSR